jgi:hypothetical protein
MANNLTPQHIVSNAALPRMSDVAQELIQLLGDPDSLDIRRLTALVTGDPVVAVQVLKRANSPALGHGRRVGSLAEALQLLGLAQVSNIAMAVFMQASIPMPPGINRIQFWESSNLAADFAIKFSYACQVDSSLAWLCAFLLRLGEIPMVQSNPKSTDLIEKGPALPGLRWTREREVFGFSEALASSEMVNQWNFPQEIVKALADCDAGLQRGQSERVSDAVLLSWMMADAICAGVHSQVELVKLIPVRLLQSVGVSPALVSDMVAEYVAASAVPA